MDRPKRGDRFIHARYLRDDARPPYTDGSYAEHVVTSVRTSGQTVVVSHISADAWDAGNHRGQWFFTLDKANESVRRWL